VAGGAGGREVGAARTAGKQALADLDAEIARTLEQQDAAKDDPALRDRMVGLLHDRTALLGFLGHLERCAAGEVACPPRLDEPKVPRDYDAAEQLIRHPFAADPTAFAGAAKAIAEASCACRTRTCVEWVLADLRRWDEGLSLEDQDDEAAAASVTLARECAWDRLGY
ncbi:MAG: hypothetical protein KC464_32685, partial [Myxococcales bacterium]|nr:hypothetical protein [Myxococcales bacterium]